MKYDLSIYISPSGSSYVDTFDSLDDCQNAVYRFREFVNTFNTASTEITINIQNTQIIKVEEIEDDTDQED